LDLAGPRSNRVRDFGDAALEIYLGLTASRKVTLLIGVAYIVAAIAVAARLSSLWYIVIFLVLWTAGHFLFIIGVIGDQEIHL